MAVLYIQKCSRAFQSATNTPERSLRLVQTASWYYVEQMCSHDLVKLDALDCVKLHMCDAFMCMPFYFFSKVKEVVTKIVLHTPLPPKTGKYF